jgi:hypothetical protein
MQQVIYVEKGDDLPAIQTMLEGAQATRVLLVLPKGYDAFRNPLDIRLLRRYALDLALDIALVTRDSRTRQVAREEGLPVVSSVRQGKRGRWRSKAPQRSSAQRAAEARIQGLRDGRGDVGYRDGVSIWGGRLLGALLFLFFLAMVVALAALLVPEARVTIVPFRESVDVELELRADPQAEKASQSELKIPARLLKVEVEQNGEIATVSKRDVPDAPATGTLTLINQLALEQEILPGAIVRTSTGTTVRFRTVTTATLPATVGARAEAQIEALAPGPVGNVPAATITTVETPALQGKIRVINEHPTRGGGVKQVGVVTRADMDRLEAQLLQQLQQRAFVELLGQLGEHEFLPPESMTTEILVEVYDQFLEAEADVLHLQMRIYASGTAVDKAGARLLAEDALKDRIPTTYELNTDEITFAMADEIAMEGRIVVLNVTSSAPLVVDVDRGEVRSAVAGLKVDEAVEVLVDSFALGAVPQIEVEPELIKEVEWLEWLDRVPFATFRIQVVVLR